LPLIPRVHLFVGSPDQVHQAAPLQDHCLQATLARTRVPRIFFPWSHSGKGRSFQFLAFTWELEDQATTSTPELATALMYQQQAGRSLAPITGWIR
jgi:hypothetical protein